MESNSFSRYKNISTPIHKIDPITKLISFILLTTLVFLSSNFIELTAVFIFVFFVSLISRTRIKTYIFSLLMMLPIFITMLPFYWFALGNINLATESVAMITFRMYIFILISIIYTSTTKEIEIALSIEWFITPFRIIKVPTYEIAMIITLAIRFIPLMFEDLRMITIAQTSRGVNLYNGSFITRVKGLFNSLLPMLVLSFKRSEDISNAMVMRGYEVGQKRSKYYQNKFRLLEIVTLLFIILLYVFVLYYLGGNI